jgi:ABC-type bacteriocin/lantibiotic exporter with double-glycine peptidase domain
MQQTECGLCCAGMLMNYYGYNISISSLRAENDIGRDGSSLLQVKNLLKKHGFDVKVYRTVFEGLKELNEPTIVLWEHRHYIVVKKIYKNKVKVIDPEYGTLTYSIEEFKEGFSGFAIYAQPTENMPEPEEKPKFSKNIIPLLFKNKWLYLGILICSIATYVGSVGFPIIIQKLIDELSRESVMSKVPYVLAAGAAYILFEFLKSTQLIYLQANIDQDINNGIFHKLLRLPYKFFDMRNKSDILVSMSSGMAIRDVLVRQIIDGLIECGAIAVIMVYLFKQNVMLAIISLIVFAIEFFIMFAVQFLLKERGMSMIASQKKLQEVQTETIFSMLNVKMLSLEESVRKKWDSRFEVYKRNFTHRELLGNALSVCSFAIVNVVPLILLIVSLMFAWDGRMTLGTALAFYSLSGTFFSLASSVCTMFISIVNSTMYIDRISDIMDQKEAESNEGKPKIDIDGNIELENVSFRYSKNSADVLKDISLSIKKGEKIALVGRSGSGKSTLAKLLVGIYQPGSGEVYLDDHKLSEIDTSYAYRQMGIVPQEITLFNKSIYENIVANRDDITQEDVEEACRIVGIADDIESMPMRYNTIVSDMGMNFSGGQRQRLALARALAGKPKILVLDEATSALDNIYEKSISDQLQDIKVTRIVIAHRLSTVYDADKIVVVEKGQIAEVGTHEELIRKGGIYKSLYEHEDNVPIGYTESA